MIPSLIPILLEFGYERAWIEATFMRDGPDHPAFRMAAVIDQFRERGRVEEARKIRAVAGIHSVPVLVEVKEWPEAEGNEM